MITHLEPDILEFEVKWPIGSITMNKTAATAAKSLQSCPTLCDPIDSSPPGSPVPGILQARPLEWGAIAFSMNKTSGGERIPVELFQILKDDAVKVMHSICQEICKTQQWPQDGKRSVFIPIPKKGNAKECSNYHIIAVISHASKVMVCEMSAIVW